MHQWLKVVNLSEVTEINMQIMEVRLESLGAFKVGDSTTNAAGREGF